MNLLLHNLLHIITLALSCYLQHICICDPLDSISYARYGILIFNQIATIKPINLYATFSLTIAILSPVSFLAYIIFFNLGNF